MEIVLLGDLNKQMPVGGWKIDDSVHETAQHLHFAIRASEFIGRKQGIRTVGLAQLVRDHAHFTQTAKLTVFIIHLNSRARKQIFKSSKKAWSCKAMFDLWFHQVRVQELMMMVMESEKKLPRWHSKDGKRFIFKFNLFHISPPSQLFTIRTKWKNVFHVEIPKALLYTTCVKLVFYLISFYSLSRMVKFIFFLRPYWKESQEKHLNDVCMWLLNHFFPIWGNWTATTNVIIAKYQNLCVCNESMLIGQSISRFASVKFSNETQLLQFCLLSAYSQTSFRSLLQSLVSHICLFTFFVNLNHDRFLVLL